MLTITSVCLIKVWKQFCQLISLLFRKQVYSFKSTSLPLGLVKTLVLISSWWLMLVTRISHRDKPKCQRLLLLSLSQLVETIRCEIMGRGTGVERAVRDRALWFCSCRYSSFIYQAGSRFMMWCAICKCAVLIFFCCCVCEVSTYSNNCCPTKRSCIVQVQVNKRNTRPISIRVEISSLCFMLYLCSGQCMYSRGRSRGWLGVL